MAEPNANPGGEGQTSTPGKPGGQQGTSPAAAPSTSPAPAPAPSTSAPDSGARSASPVASDATRIPQSVDETKDMPADRGALAVDARTVKNAEGEDVRVVGDPDAPLTQVSDPEGKVSNRVEGTIQREPTPEELPADAKIAPLAEQVAPNQAAQAVGARPTPDTIAGIDQPEEGEKNPVSDSSDPAQFLSPESDQHEEAERSAEDANRRVDRVIDRGDRAAKREGR